MHSGTASGSLYQDLRRVKTFYVGQIYARKLTATGVSFSCLVAIRVYSAAKAMSSVPSIVVGLNNLRVIANWVGAGDAYNFVATLWGLYNRVLLYGGGGGMVQ